MKKSEPTRQLEIDYLDKTKIERKVLNIHSGAVSIENKVSLISRKAWFYMVYKAFPKLLQQEKFSMPLSELKEAIGYDSKNNKYLKEALLELVNTSIEWNILKKDKSVDWEVNSMLAGCKIPANSGICEFAFSPFLKEKLSNPEMYVKLDLLMSRSFKSKHTLSLYCFMLDYLQVKYNFGSKNLTINELRKILGLNESEYTRVVDINKEILKKAEKEINENTDLNVSIEPIRTANRKITSFKFEMSLKKEYLNFYRSKNVLTTEKPIDLIEEGSSKDLNNFIKIQSEEIRKFFVKYNISTTTDTFQEKLVEIQELFGTNLSESYLNYLTKYAESEYRKGNIKNFAGFFVSLIKDNSQIDNFLYEMEKENKRVEEKKIKVENKLESKIKEKYDTDMSNDFETYIVENIETLEAKFIEIINTHITTGLARDFLINKQNNGIVDKTLILNHKKHFRFSLITELKKFQEELGYKKPTFELWKTKTIDDKYLQELRNEIEKDLS